MRNPIKVAIVGAGIGGLSAAIALRKIGAEVVVLERAPEILVLGAGICLWPNGGQALKALGLEPALADVSPILKNLSYLDKNGKSKREMSFDFLTQETGHRSFPIARADLHMALLGQLDPSIIKLGAATVGAKQTANGAIVELEDGSVFEADLVIGADGIRSVVRNAVTEGNHTLRYHYSTWCGLVPENSDVCPRDTFKFFVSDAKRVGLLNVGDDRLYFFCDAAVENVDQDGDGTRAQLKKLYAGWCPSVQAVIDAIDDTKTSRLPVCDLDPLDSYVKGRVVLIGDAAHGTTPTLGQGGAMAMEDAIVLARCLAASPDFDAALKAYDAERRPRSEAIVLSSRARTAAALGLDKEKAESWQAQLSDESSHDFMDEQVRIFKRGPLAATV